MKTPNDIEWHFEEEVNNTGYFDSDYDRQDEMMYVYKNNDGWRCDYYIFRERENENEDFKIRYYNMDNGCYYIDDELSEEDMKELSIEERDIIEKDLEKRYDEYLKEKYKDKDEERDL